MNNTPEKSSEEKLVDFIVDKAGDCVYGMNLNLSAKESKQMLEGIERSYWFRNEITQALKQTKADTIQEERAGLVKFLKEHIAVAQIAGEPVYLHEMENALSVLTSIEK